MCDHAIIMGKDYEEYDEELSYRELMGQVVKQRKVAKIDRKFSDRVNIYSQVLFSSLWSKSSELNSVTGVL